jgi:hypothetical protein
MTAKALSIAGFIIVANLLALFPAASTIYREAYPAEAVKRAALAVCAHDDPGFSPLFANERARCYARTLRPEADDWRVSPSEKIAGN